MSSRRPRGAMFDEGFLRKLESLHLLSRKTYLGTNRRGRKTKISGSGIEFADHRSYSLGDDFRTIDWNAYGRFDTLLVKLFEREEDLSVTLLLDCSRSMSLGAPSKFDVARKIAAALSYVALANLDRVGIGAFSSDAISHLPTTQGKGRILSVFKFLSGLSAEGGTDLSASIETLARNFKRPGLAIIISDFYDPQGFERGIQVLRYRGFDPFVIQIFDPSEVQPRFSGDLSIVDCETGETQRITVTEALLKRYSEEHGVFRENLRRFCRSRGVPHVSTQTDVSFEDLVLKVFKEGGFLK